MFCRISNRNLIFEAVSTDGAAQQGEWIRSKRPSDTDTSARSTLNTSALQTKLISLLCLRGRFRAAAFIVQNETRIEKPVRTAEL